MKKQREKNIAGLLRDVVRMEGGLAIKLSAAVLAGIPDYIVLLNGKAKFVETKSEGKKPRRLQLKMHEFLRGLGFSVFVIDSKEDICSFVKSFR